jgi:hypothetical protein
MPEIDWLIFDKYPESTCRCACEKMYRSHSKFIFEDGKPRVISRKPCPDCGSDNPLAVYGDREEYNL